MARMFLNDKKTFCEESKYFSWTVVKWHHAPGHFIMSSENYHLHRNDTTFLSADTCFRHGATAQTRARRWRRPLVWAHLDPNDVRRVWDSEGTGLGAGRRAGGGQGSARLFGPSRAGWSRDRLLPVSEPPGDSADRNRVDGPTHSWHGPCKNTPDGAAAASAGAPCVREGYERPPLGRPRPPSGSDGAAGCWPGQWRKARH